MQDSFQERPTSRQNNGSIVLPGCNVSKTYQKTLLNILFFCAVTIRKNSQTITLSAVAATAAFLAFGLIATPSLVFADSPHFISAASSLSGAFLVCTFKEAGLGNLGFTNIKETCSATASALYVCVNGGGNHPSAANKETVTAPVSNGGFFPIRNGQTTGSITVAPPGPGNFHCPGGQTLALASVTYTNVIVCDQLGNCVPLASQTFRDPSVPT